jgi:hypothetical protein
MKINLQTKNPNLLGQLHDKKLENHKESSRSREAEREREKEEEEEKTKQKTASNTEEKYYEKKDIFVHNYQEGE